MGSLHDADGSRAEFRGLSRYPMVPGFGGGGFVSRGELLPELLVQTLRVRCAGRGLLLRRCCCRLLWRSARRRDRADGRRGRESRLGVDFHPRRHRHRHGGNSLFLGGSGLSRRSQVLIY